MARWVMEKAVGRGVRRRWEEVFCWVGNERNGSDISMRYFLGTQVRWHPLGEEFPCSIGADPNAKYDAGEF